MRGEIYHARWFVRPVERHVRSISFPPTLFGSWNVFQAKSLSIAKCGAISGSHTLGELGAKPRVSRCKSWAFPISSVIIEGVFHSTMGII